MARQLKVVSPEGILHFVLDETTAKGNFCRAHGLRTAYFNLYVISKGTETNGWQLLENIKYLQHVASGAIVVVVGKPKQFLDAREAACLRAGLASDAMPFRPDNASELRQFQRLLHKEDTVTEMSGWKCIEEPPIVRTIMADVACTACGCLTDDLFQLLNGQVAAQAASREAVLRAQQELSDATKIAQRHQAELAEAEVELESKRLAVKVAEDQLAAHLAALRQEARTDDALMTGASGSDAAVAEPATRAFDQICDLDRSRFQPMSDFSFSTWRQALHYSLARAAVIKPEMLAKLYDAWDATRGAFEATGANSLQFIAFIERVRPYEFNLLAHAALGVERHRLAESCMSLPLPSGANMLPELAQRMTARILMSMTGTTSQREREDCETLTPTYLRNRFNGSMMREICILHSLEPKLLLSLQTHLGIAVRAAVNMSELTQYLLSFQIVPNEELSRKWLLQVQEDAQENRISRLIEWMAQGDGWTLRFDNCDVGKLLHFVALIATRDRAPPPSPFPFGPPSQLPVLPRSTCPPALSSLDLEHFEPLSAFEVAAQASWWAIYDAAAASIDRCSAAGAAKISRAALLRRTKRGLETSIIHSARALGPALECQALGAPPTAMDVDACGEGRRKRDRPRRGGFDLRQVRDTLLSPPRRSARAVCDYKPSVHLPSAIAVSERQLLTLLECEPHDTICLVRTEDGNIGHLPTFIIGQGAMVQAEDRELWELALVEGTKLAPAPNRMELARRLLVLPRHDMEDSTLDLNHANGYSSKGKWTQQTKEARKARRRETRVDEDEDDEGDKEDDYNDDHCKSDGEEYTPSGGSSDGSSDGSSVKSADEGPPATPSEPSAPEPSPKRPKATGCPPPPHPSAATTQSPAPPQLPFNLQVRGKFGDRLLYIAPVLQKATDAGVTQACMSLGRLLLDDLRTRDEQLWRLEPVQVGHLLFEGL